MRLPVLLVLLLLAVAPARAADVDVDAGEAEAPEENRLPRVDELVPGLTTELPPIDVGVDRQVPYPDADDILRAMREIPPLERPRGSEAEKSLTRDQ
jgi:hypothetical protein